MIELMARFDELLDNELSNIDNYLTSGYFESSIFDLVKVMSPSDDRPKELKGRKGVYFFFMTENQFMSRSLINSWQSESGATFFDWQERELKEGDCLYLGSSASLKTGSLYVRIGEHIGGNKTHTALKLSLENRSILKDKLVIYIFALRRELKPYCNVILPPLEHKLHEKYKPKAGSSR